jgi:hypothetical protein
MIPRIRDRSRGTPTCSNSISSLMDLEFVFRAVEVPAGNRSKSIRLTDHEGFEYTTLYTNELELLGFRRSTSIRPAGYNATCNSLPEQNLESRKGVLPLRCLPVPHTRPSFRVPRQTLPTSQASGRRSPKSVPHQASGSAPAAA